MFTYKKCCNSSLKYNITNKSILLNIVYSRYMSPFIVQSQNVKKINADLCFNDGFYFFDILFPHHITNILYKLYE